MAVITYRKQTDRVYAYDVRRNGKYLGDVYRQILHRVWSILPVAIGVIPRRPGGYPTRTAAANALVAHAAAYRRAVRGHK
jgi:hypothetical protein